MDPRAELDVVRTFISRSPEATEEAGEQLGRLAQAGLVILLDGDLGTGKTCLSRGFGRGLGVPEVVTSPTFALMNRYEGRLPLLHFDAWMEGRERALLADGGAELVGGEAVTLIEWGERVGSELGHPALSIRMGYLGPAEGQESRRMTLTAASSDPGPLGILRAFQPQVGALEEIQGE
jgi:tRNA threonylcarbamoyladenosine biosynthesis protein TsaE